MAHTMVRSPILIGRRFDLNNVTLGGDKVSNPAHDRERQGKGERRERVRSPSSLPIMIERCVSQSGKGKGGRGKGEKGESRGDSGREYPRRSGTGRGR